MLPKKLHTHFHIQHISNCSFSQTDGRKLMLAITSRVALCQEQWGLFAFNNSPLVSIWCINNGGQAKLFQHSSGSSSYVNSLSTCAQSSVCPQYPTAEIVQSGSYLPPCLSVLRWRGAGLQAGLMESYGMSLTSYLRIHPSAACSKQSSYTATPMYSILLKESKPNSFEPYWFL